MSTLQPPPRAAAGNIPLFLLLPLCFSSWWVGWWNWATTDEVLLKRLGALKIVLASLVLPWYIFTKNYFQTYLKATCQQERLTVSPSSYLYGDVAEDFENLYHVLFLEVIWNVIQGLHLLGPALHSPQSSGLSSWEDALSSRRKRSVKHQHVELSETYHGKEDIEN